MNLASSCTLFSQGFFYDAEEAPWQDHTNSYFDKLPVSIILTPEYSYCNIFCENEHVTPALYWEFKVAEMCHRALLDQFHG
jgi:hypothetical protein